MTEKKNTPHPALYMLYSLLFSYVGASLVFGVAAWLRGKKRHSAMVLGGMLLLIILQAALSLQVKMPWWGHSLILLFLNLNSGAVLLALGYSMGAESRKAEEVPGGYREVLFGFATGGFLGVITGPFLSVIQMLIVDALFSEYAPINFDMSDVMASMFLHSIITGIMGAVIGTVYGRRGENLTAARLLLHIGYICIASTCFMLTWAGFFYVPLFQLYQIINSAGSLVGSMLIFYLLYIPLCVWAILFMADQRNIFSFLSRFSFLVLLLLLSGLNTSIYSGMVGYDCLLVGRHLEKEAELQKAVTFYQMGLLSHRNSAMDSYFQFKIGLLERKLGDLKAAESAFGKVLTRYYANKHLVERARYFLDSIQDSSPASDKRVVIRGVETRTEYKGSFCCPNTLALLLRYWGEHISAREIGEKTSFLGLGTLPLDETRFVRSMGKVYYTRPLADTEDIMELINLSIPVAVYIPGHIFAIFGYDLALDTFVTYDVADMDIWVDLPREEFISEWGKRYNTLSILLPPEKTAVLPEKMRSGISRSTLSYLHYMAAHSSQWKNDTEEIAHLDKALHYDPSMFFIEIEKAWLFPDEKKHLTPERTETIIMESEKFLSACPENTDFLTEYVSYLISLDRVDRARMIMEEKAERNELPGDLRDTLGLIYYYEKKYEKAASFLMYKSSSGGEEEAGEDADGDYSPPSLSADRSFALADSFQKTGSRRAALNRFMGILGTCNGNRFSRVAVRRILSLAREMKMPETAKKGCEEYLKQNPYDVPVRLSYTRLLIEFPAKKKDVRKEELRKASSSLSALRALPLEKGESREMSRLALLLRKARGK